MRQRLFLCAIQVNKPQNHINNISINGKFYTNKSITISHKRYFHSSYQVRKDESYYEILGVSKDASPEDIKKAYYSIARQNHPDNLSSRNDPTSHKKFTLATEAYEVLSNEKKRKFYDKFGVEKEGRSLEDILEQQKSVLDPYGEMYDASEFKIGESIEVPIKMTLEEAARGAVKEIVFESTYSCADCDGSGIGPEGKSSNCEACDGLGYVKEGKGLMSSNKLCSKCAGYGNIIDKNCNSCKGDGVVKKQRKIKIQIPPGVDTDYQITLEGKGGIGKRKCGKNGDLFLPIEVEKHPKFYRIGDNIHIDIPITVAQAILGGPINIPTIDGNTVEIKIPPSTQPDDTFILFGKGVYKDSYSRGKQIVHFKIHIPKDLTKEQVDLVAQLSKPSENINEPSSSQTKESLNNLSSIFKNK